MAIKVVVGRPPLDAAAAVDDAAEGAVVVGELVTVTTVAEDDVGNGSGVEVARTKPVPVGMMVRGTPSENTIEGNTEGCCLLCISSPMIIASIFISLFV